MKKFKRINEDEFESLIGGVCAGLAYSWAIPVWIIRVVWFLCIWFYGSGIFLYLILWVFVPEWEEIPEDFQRRAA